MYNCTIESNGILYLSLHMGYKKIKDNIVHYKPMQCVLLLLLPFCCLFLWKQRDVCFFINVCCYSAAFYEKINMSLNEVVFSLFIFNDLSSWFSRCNTAIKQFYKTLNMLLMSSFTIFIYVTKKSFISKQFKWGTNIQNLFYPFCITLLFLASGLTFVYMKVKGRVV